MASCDSKSDLRSARQDTKRAAAHKAKWAQGIHTTAPGRSLDNPRPVRTSDHLTPNTHRHRVGGSVFKAANAGRTDMLAARSEWPSLSSKIPNHTSDDSSSSSDECDPTSANVVAALDETELVYGAKGISVPSHGSQVLHGALAKAIVAFEDKETVKLVRTEWSVLDDEGEEVGLTPVKRKARAVVPGQQMLVEDEEDYEIV